MIKLVLVVLAGVLVCAHAGGYAQYAHGFAIPGPYGAAKVNHKGDNFGYAYGVDQVHKGGSSYIHQTGNFHHGYGHHGHGGFGYGGHGGYGGYGGHGGFGYGGHGFGYGK